jgi:hypothetical protein
VCVECVCVWCGDQCSCCWHVGGCIFPRVARLLCVCTSVSRVVVGWLSQDATGASVDTTFEGFTLYKHRSSAVWVRGTGPRVRNAFVADSAVCVRLLGGPNLFEDGVVIGVSG